MRGLWRGRALAVGAALALAGSAGAQVIEQDRPAPIRGLEVVSRLGQAVPRDIELTDSFGRTVTLGEYFDRGLPIVLTLLYYDCPFVCPRVLQGVAEAVAGLNKTPGEQYLLLAVSFDPGNTTAMAEAARQQLLGSLGADRGARSAAGVAFHIAAEAQVRRLAEAVGYEYRYLPEIDEYAHPVVLVVLTPTGVVSRYLYGFDYPPRDLNLALLEASEGKSATSLGDAFLHFCYRYDPTAGTYTLQAMRVMRVGATAGAVLLAAMLVALKVSEHVSRRRRGSGGRPAVGPGGERVVWEGHRA